jgi:hypothetical protein
VPIELIINDIHTQMHGKLKETKSRQIYTLEPSERMEGVMSDKRRMLHIQAP